MTQNAAQNAAQNTPTAMGNVSVGYGLNNILCLLYRYVLHAMHL